MGFRAIGVAPRKSDCVDAIAKKNRAAVALGKRGGRARAARLARLITRVWYAASVMITVVQTNKPIVVPDSLRRRAGIKAGDRLEFKVSGGIINIIPELPSADDEYTPEQRRMIDARLAKSLEDVKKGRTYGPFHSAREMIGSIESELKKRRGAKRAAKRTR